MLREHSWWLDLVVITREHQDRDVDVEKTDRDVLRQTVFRPLQASFVTGAQTVFDDLLPKLGSQRLIGQHPINALLHGLLIA